MVQIENGRNEIFKDIPILIIIDVAVADKRLPFSQTSRSITHSFSQPSFTSKHGHEYNVHGVLWAVGTFFPVGFS